LAKERVRDRVVKGGHNIESDVIARRYVSGIKNLFDIYISFADVVLFIDNSEINYEIIAKRASDFIDIINPSKFNQLKGYYGNEKKK
jgi:predicted ABC-type ATPase